jgi:hypothetical protein
MAAIKERLMATYLLNFTSGDHYLQPTKTEIVWPGTQFVWVSETNFLSLFLECTKSKKERYSTIAKCYGIFSALWQSCKQLLSPHLLVRRGPVASWIPC